MNIAELIKKRSGSGSEHQLVASLRKMLEEKQAEIEALKSGDVRVGNLPSKVYKKLEHVNA